MSIKSRTKHEVMKVHGITRFCHLNEPNKRFNPEFGSWECDLVMTDEETENLKNRLRPLYEEELKACAEENAGKEIKRADMPFKKDEDGMHVARIKLKAGGRRADGTIYKLGIALYDAKGSPLPKDVKVWGGSSVNVAFRPRFWFTPVAGFGVSLELAAVQVLKLANGGISDVAASAFGFTEEEGFAVNGGENLDTVFDNDAENNEQQQTEKISATDF